MSSPNNSAVPNQPSDEQAPDSASLDYLKKLLSSARPESPAPPLATTLPEISLGTKGDGLLDLQNAIAQMLELSTGATALHCILAADFLLDQSIMRLKQTLTHLGPPEGKEEALAQLRILGDVSKLLHSQAVVRDVASFPVITIARDRAEGDIDDISTMSRFLVTDGNLRSLGIEPDEYHAFIASRDGDDPS